jgi:hypothetical protein
VVNASEEHGEDPDLGQRLVDLEVEDEPVAGHRADGGPDLRVLGAAVGIALEGSRAGEGSFDPGGRTFRRALRIAPEFL